MQWEFPLPLELGSSQISRHLTCQIDQLEIYPKVWDEVWKDIAMYRRRLGYSHCRDKLMQIAWTMLGVHWGDWGVCVEANADWYFPYTTNLGIQQYIRDNSGIIVLSRLLILRSYHGCHLVISTGKVTSFVQKRPSTPLPNPKKLNLVCKFASLHNYNKFTFKAWTSVRKL